VWGECRCLFRDSYEARKYTVCQNVGFYMLCRYGVWCVFVCVYHWASNACLRHYVYEFVTQNSVHLIHLGVQSVIATNSSQFITNFVCRSHFKPIKCLCLAFYLHVWQYIYEFGIMYLLALVLYVCHYIYAFSL
jgi:hypothetical protein